jgi:hypothetical protein
MIRRLMVLLGLAGMSTGFAATIYVYARLIRTYCGPRGGINAEGIANCYQKYEPDIAMFSVFFGAAALALVIAILLPSPRSAQN